jgi:soluble lytic murein transglycosylase-like protein
MRKFPYVTGALLLLTGALQAGERVVLTTGFELRADRHEVEGNTVRIFSGSGVTELPQTLIAEYKLEEYTAPNPETAKTEAKALEQSQPAKAFDPRQLIRELVEKKNLPKELIALIESVIRQESGFRADAISPKGAIGLMQLMPGTAKVLGVDPHDPEQNLEAGARYLVDLLVKYADRDDQVLRALAAYNAGPGAVDKYHGIPPYRETRDYVRRVVQNYLSLQRKATGG